MIRINRDERDWLISKGYLKLVRGQYEGLVVCNREHNSKSKTYYVWNKCTYYLSLRMKQLVK